MSKSKDGIIRIKGRHISFTEIIRMDAGVAVILLNNGWTVQVPKKSIIRLPEGVVIQKQEKRGEKIC